MNNLAATLKDLGDASGARELHEAALAGRRRLLAEEHPDTLISMHNLACLQEDSEGMELDQQLVEELLSGVRSLPEGTPIGAAEPRWSRRAS